MDYKNYLIKALEKEITSYKDKEKRIMYIAGFLSCMEDLGIITMEELKHIAYYEALKD